MNNGIQFNGQQMPNMINKLPSYLDIYGIIWSNPCEQHASNEQLARISKNDPVFAKFPASHLAIHEFLLDIYPYVIYHVLPRVISIYIV